MSPFRVITSLLLRVIVSRVTEPSPFTTPVFSDARIFSCRGSFLLRACILWIGPCFRRQKNLARLSANALIY